MLNNQNIKNFKNKRAGIKSKSFKNTKNIFLINNLINDLYKYLSNIVPEKVATKASINASEIFTYYLENKVEEIILVLNKKYNSWNIMFKVCPSYLNDHQNLRKIEDHIKKNTTVLSLKYFYFNHAKKYFN